MSTLCLNQSKNQISLKMVLYLFCINTTYNVDIKQVKNAINFSFAPIKAHQCCNTSLVFERIKHCLTGSKQYY